MIGVYCEIEFWGKLKLWNSTCTNVTRFTYLGRLVPSPSLLQLPAHTSSRTGSSACCRHRSEPCGTRRNSAILANTAVASSLAPVRRPLVLWCKFSPLMIESWSRIDNSKGWSCVTKDSRARFRSGWNFILSYLQSKYFVFLIFGLEIDDIFKCKMSCFRLKKWMDLYFKNIKRINLMFVWKCQREFKFYS